MTAATFADHRRADEAEDEARLRCKAPGCPRRWATDAGGQLLCTAHARAPVCDWPGLTERILWEESERARRNGEAAALEARGPGARACTRPDAAQLAALQALRDAIAARSPRQTMTQRWMELRRRERAGEHLHRVQAEAWRAALKVNPHADAWAPAWFENATEEVRPPW